MIHAGVTQELIDDTRLSTEKKMLDDMKELANTGGDLEMLGRSGETPVSNPFNTNIFKTWFHTQIPLFFITIFKKYPLSDLRGARLPPNSTLMIHILESPMFDIDSIWIMHLYIIYQLIVPLIQLDSL